ncbi:hypothetical protein MMC27_002441 [Xylographa pallens]|nr:hypothetical protein [Xylographa pallens]
MPLIGVRFVSEEQLRDNTKANQRFPALSLFPSLVLSSSPLSMLPISSQGAYDMPQYHHDIVLDLLKLFDDLKDLRSVIKATSADNNAPCIMSISFARTMYFAIQQMLPWFSETGVECSSSGTHCNSPIRKSFYLSILIYVDQILRTVRDAFPATSGFVHEILEPALVQFSTSRVQLVEMFMFVLVKDDWSAWTLAAKAWYTAMAVDALISMSWEEWRRVEHLLELFTSCKDLRDGPSKNFWDAVLA